MVIELWCTIYIHVQAMSLTTYQLADIDGVEGYLWQFLLGDAKLQTCKEPHECADRVEDGGVRKAEGEVHSIMS